MSSKIIVDTIEKKTGDDVTLVGNLDVPTSYKITGTDADSIQAPGLITSAGGGLNTSLNTGLASATFPAGMILQVVYADRTGSSQVHINDTSNFMSGDLNTGLITLKQSNSKILIEGVVTQAPTTYSGSFYRTMEWGWNTSSTGLYSGIQQSFAGKGSGSQIDEDVNEYNPSIGKWFVTAPSSSFTIYMVAKAQLNSNTFIGGGKYHTSLTVYEIAQ